MNNLEAFKGLYSWIDQRQWSSKQQNDKFLLINNFTGDQFTPQKIDIFSRHIYQVYKARSSYHIIHTPKIILPDNQENKDFIYLLVQRGIPAFYQYLQQSLDSTQCLEVFKQILILIMTLSKKYGLFRVKKNMIKMTRLGFFQVWISQSQQICHRQFPLNSGNQLMDCKTMINDLLSIFMSSKHQKSLLYFSELLNQYKNCSLQNAKYLLQLAIKKQRFSLNKNIIVSPKSQCPEFLRNKKQLINIQNSDFTNSSNQNPNSLSDKKSNQSLPQYTEKKRNNTQINVCKNYSKTILSNLRNANKKRNIKSTQKNHKNKNLSYMISQKKNFPIRLSIQQNSKKRLNAHKVAKSFINDIPNKKQFRESANSFSTTNLYQSTYNSSLKNQESFNFFDKKLLTSFGSGKIDQTYTDKKVITSFGNKSQDRKLLTSFGKNKKDENFNLNINYEKQYVQILKTIEEKQDAPNNSSHSPGKSQIQQHIEKQRQIYQDFQNILMSQQIKIQQTNQQDLKALQKQINNILFA